jgi:redox-sensing transcriptional repressor
MERAAEDPVSDASKVPLQTVERLSRYRRVLADLQDQGVEAVFSHRLADLVGVTPAQLRRDLSIFGSFGSVARGYDVVELHRTIGRLLGTDQVQTLALIGMGNLGRTLLMYRGFEERGFHIGPVFDRDREKIGKVYAGRRCYAIDDLEATLPDFDCRMAILACGPVGLDALVARLAALGVRSVLNFVPQRVNAPDGVFVEDVDLSAKLEKLSFLSRS